MENVSFAMNARRVAVFLGQLGAFGVSGVRSSRAAEPPCASMVVEADARVRAEWPDLPTNIHDAFFARDEVAYQRKDLCSPRSREPSNKVARQEVTSPKLLYSSPARLTAVQ